LDSAGGFGPIIAIVTVAITAPLWAPYSAKELGGVPFSGASSEHWFGTDYLGRDVFSRVVLGARLELILIAVSTLAASAVGIVWGLVAAYMDGVVDDVLMRVADAFISIPFLVLGLLIVGAFGSSATGNYALMVMVMVAIYAPRMARVSRSAALAVVGRDFVIMSRLRGERAGWIVMHDVFPNARNTILVELALRLGNAPVVIGSLGFLGFGVRPPNPEWGLMISENRNALLAAPSIVIGPSIALAILVVSVNLFTEGLSRVLGDSGPNERAQ
jgi:peptide/nickel transport system permease protein